MHIVGVLGQDCDLGMSGDVISSRVVWCMRSTWRWKSPLMICGEGASGAHVVPSMVGVMCTHMEVVVVLVGELLGTVGTFMDLLKFDSLVGFLVTDKNVFVSERLGALGAGEGAKSFGVVDR